MFQRIKGQTIVITGASSGFGKSTAYLYASYGGNLVLFARRIEMLEEIKNDIESKFGVKVHIDKMDVSNKQEVVECFKRLPAFAEEKIDVLINNAGKALGVDPVETVDESVIDEVFDTNVKGLVFVTQQVIKKMKERNEGAIVNVGSIAGITAYGGGSIYCASKFALRAITDSLRIETNSTKIRVIEIDPGMVKTDFSLIRFGGDQTKAENVYKGADHMVAEDIAEAIVFATSRHPRCVVSQIVCLANGQANPFVLHREE
ncbi:putative oxidoreductase [Zancudomyces culisetae]|uniref:Putative oxidoreductase n=1 Tax=Zancudomyces culisetae TaxID=1213189 RepID=A0A1R1PTD4_ZANCU|nr:putative oxidoreductase [Zancudomyces culisetae]|eukprot:OMH84189.1 putative oxidoreductase [Zancudomyces culisetae]